MTKLSRAVPVLAMALALAACAYPIDKPPIYEGTCSPAAPAALAKADWSKAKVFDVTITADSVEPMVMHLVNGRPYIFRFANRDDEPRVITSVSFFTRQAIAQATVAGKSFERPCMNALNIPAGQSAEVRLVTLEKGNYGFSGAPFAYISLTRSADLAVLTVD